MPNSRDTIANRLQRALLKIAESLDATVQEKLDAVNLILKAKELAKNKDRTAPRKLPKPVSQHSNVLGTK